MRDSRQSTPASAALRSGGVEAGSAAAVFATHLRVLRRERGWSQQAVAEAMKGMGFSWRQTTVAKTEAGDRPVLLGEAVALAQVFGKGMDYFLESQSPLEAVIEEAAEGIAEQRARLLTLEAQTAETTARLRYGEAVRAVAIAVKAYADTYDSGPLLHELEGVFQEFRGYAIAVNEAYELVGVSAAELREIDSAALREVAEYAVRASTALDRGGIDEGGNAILNAASSYLRTGHEDVHLFQALRSFDEWVELTYRNVVDLIVERFRRE